MKLWKSDVMPLKRWIVCHGLLSLVAFSALSCADSEAERQVAAMTLDEVAAYWAVRGQDAEKNNYIHPVVRFRVVNDTNGPVGYVQAMAVFKRDQFPEESWGTAFAYSISEEPLEAGAQSDVITMRCDSNFISKDAPEEMFANEKWEEIGVEIFLRVGPSSWHLTQAMGMPKQIGAPGLEKFLEPEDDQAPVPQ